MNAMIKRIALMLLALLLVAGAAFAQEDLEARYAQAQELLQSEDYEAAAEAFAALGDYSDSERQYKRARYNIALKLFDAEQYHEANTIFEELGDYQNSQKNAYTSFLRARIADYRKAKELYNNGEYEAAKALFESLGKYEDARERAAEAEKQIQAIAQAKRETELYAQAVELLAEQDAKGAYDAFLLAGPHEGATEGMYQAVVLMAQQDIYSSAQEALVEGRNAEARLMFEALGEYEDSAEQAAAITLAAGEELDENESKYQLAMLLRKQWKREEANALFTELGDYKDAADRVEILPPGLIPAEALRDDATTPYSDVFTAPDGSKHYYRIFKGMHTWVEAKYFCELLGGHMATLTSKEENEFVYWFMRDNDFLTAYFGLSDEKRVGNWIWVTGEPFEYSNWNYGEPSRSGKERYGMYFYKHTKGTWNDSHFYETDKWGEPGCSFICEWDVPEDEE